MESFGRSPALLAAVLRQLPKKMWLYKPSLERWSIHEIIVHQHVGSLMKAHIDSYAERFIPEKDRKAFFAHVMEDLKYLDKVRVYAYRVTESELDVWMKKYHKK